MISRQQRLIRSGVGLLLFAALAGVRPAQAQGAERGQPIVTTTHQIRIRGHFFKYIAQAGRLPIRDVETGRAHGYIFFVGYRIASSGAPRPVTFLWNGGPGSNSALQQFGALGPKIISGSKLVDNDATLLPSSDLVFVDPVGTGFSRPARRAYEAEFYNTLGDIASITEFVRVWRDHFNAEKAPVFLLGESFGVWRAAGVAEAMEKRGHHVAGIVLISGGTGMGNALPENIRTALQVPNRAATALYFHRLPADLGSNRDAIVKEATKWALRVYAPALAHRDKLSQAEREAVAKDLARFTGLKISQIDTKTLVVTPRQYLKELLQDQKLTLNTFDMRQTTPAEQFERSKLVAGLVNHYFRFDLGYRTDLLYIGLGGGLDQGYVPIPGPNPRPINERWNYNSGVVTPQAIAAAKAGEGPPGSEPWALRAIHLDPKMKVMVAAGLYDSLNSCAANEYLLKNVEPAAAPNYVLKCYPGGHMMYLDPGLRRKLSADIAKFIKSTLAGSR